MTFKDHLVRFFTWWNGQTYGTQLFTRRHGRAVGHDARGNAYYQTADGARRWVVYAAEAEATQITAEWFAWLHHTVDAPPSPDAPRRFWEKPSLPNLTGTPMAYAPPGSLLRAEPAPRRDYESWSPE